jgi:hypothetical protein
MEAGAALQYPLDAIGFDTHAVVATFIPGQPSAVGIALAQLPAVTVLSDPSAMAPATGFFGINCLPSGIQCVHTADFPCPRRGQRNSQHEPESVLR